MRVTANQYGVDAALEDAAEEIVRLRDVPQEVPTREALAHIIDPKCFIIPNSTRFEIKDRQRDAFAKADAILALSAPSAGGRHVRLTVWNNFRHAHGCYCHWCMQRRAKARAAMIMVARKEARKRRRHESSPKIFSNRSVDEPR